MFYYVKLGRLLNLDFMMTYTSGLSEPKYNRQMPVLVPVYCLQSVKRVVENDFNIIKFEYKVAIRNTV